LVIIVTAVEPDFDIVDMPFDDYLVKPVTGDDLSATVISVLERASFRETARDYFAKASKQAALAGYKHQAQLESNEEYQRIQRELDELRDRADAAIEELGPDAVKELFQDHESN
jgi:DNA-binding response OmpR family regulator